MEFLDKGFAVCVDGAYVKDGRLLLLKRRVEPFKGYWSLVGGHVDDNETLKEALRREFKEETCLNVKVGDIIDVRLEKTFDRTKIIIVFQVISAEGEIHLDSENEDYGWFTEIPANSVYISSKYFDECLRNRFRSKKSQESC